jgi:hypothetical protein
MLTGLRISVHASPPARCLAAPDEACDRGRYPGFEALDDRGGGRVGRKPEGLGVSDLPAPFRAPL